MPPYDYNDNDMGCPAMKFKYGKDCLCENRAACRGLTAAFSMLGNDPRGGFVRLPSYKENPESQFYIERNLQRESYLRHLLPNHPPQQEALAKDIALHHFHPRVVQRLVSNLQKSIPKALPEEQLVQLGLKLDDRDKLFDENGSYTGRRIFAPSYPIENSKQDLKRLLRLCRVLNQGKKGKTTTASTTEKSLSPLKGKKKKQRPRRFHPDIRNDDDLADKDSNDREEQDEEITSEERDSLAEYNIPSLLESIIRLEPIPEELDPDTDDHVTAMDKEVETLPTLDTDLESESDEEDTRPNPNLQATVSMQIGLERLHTGKGKNRLTKITKRPPSPFFEISVLHGKDTKTREIIYRSYPLTDTKNATWDFIESLDLGVDVHTPEDLSFCITVFDLSPKGGDHLLIGTCEANALHLFTTSHMSIPIYREDKIKGFLQFSAFQLHTAVDNNSLGSDASQTNSIGSDSLGRSSLPDENPRKTDLPFDHSRDQDISFESHDNGLRPPPSTPTLSMQVSLEKLCSGKVKNLASKVRNKSPNPFFEFSVLHTNGWETLYRSYPLTCATSATWDPVEGLDLGPTATKDLLFRITVYDCDVKSGAHLVIGETEMNTASEVSQNFSIPILRKNKIKGYLRLDRYEIHWPTKQDDGYRYFSC